MKNVEQITKGTGYTAINMGTLDCIGEYSLIHPKVPYFHRHMDNEETYIVLKGSGDFQIDDDCFPIREGSVIRIAPTPSRGMRNSSDESMIYMVIQSKENSLGNYSTEDGKRTEWDPKW